MKRVFTRILPSLLLLGFLSCQFSYAQQTEATGVKYWIFLKDKAAPASKVGRAEISTRALERRNRRGSGYSNELDILVSPIYLDDLEAHGVEPVHTSRWLNAVSAYLTADEAGRVASLPYVRRVQTVGRTQVKKTVESPLPMRFDAFPRRLDYGFSETQLSLVNAIQNLEQGINGTGVILGIVDTGIGELTHPAFDLMLSEGRFLESRDFTGLPDDNHRHGRYVLSIAAGYMEGNLIGPAYGAKILHARTEYTRSETIQEEDNLVAGLEWMESEGVDVINISLGYYTFDNDIGSYTYADMDGDTAISTVAVDRAVQLGVSVVSSAGNEGGCPYPACWYYIGAPADADSVIAVGATNSAGKRASFSSFGPTSDGRTKPDISAMGVSVAFANSSGTVSLGNGTSFSSPMVAGIVAQMLQMNPDLSPIQIRAIIKQTAINPFPSGMQLPNDTLGWGIIDAVAAVEMAISTEPDSSVPVLLELSALYPNPAQHTITFRVKNMQWGRTLSVDVYDMLGRLVLQTSQSKPGTPTSRLSLATERLVPGIYAYRLAVESQSVTGTFAVVR